jgi:putative transposase
MRICLSNKTVLSLNAPTKNSPAGILGDLSLANSKVGVKSDGWRALLRLSECATFLVILLHLIVTMMRLAKPGEFRSVVAESVLIRHQLLILNRGRKRAPNLQAWDRIVAGLCTLFIRRARILRSAIVLKPSTLLHLHRLLTQRKYRVLFSPRYARRSGPKGPGKALIDAVVEMKRRNPGWGCPRIAQQVALAFGVEIDKDVVRRILNAHYRPESEGSGPSWLTFLGHAKDSPR